MLWHGPVAAAVDTVISSGEILTTSTRACAWVAYN
jgi:hypothetical protein